MAGGGLRQPYRTIRVRAFGLPKELPWLCTDSGFLPPIPWGFLNFLKKKKKLVHLSWVKGIRKIFILFPVFCHWVSEKRRAGCPWWPDLVVTEGIKMRRKNQGCLNRHSYCPPPPTPQQFFQDFLWKCGGERWAERCLITITYTQ